MISRHKRPTTLTSVELWRIRIFKKNQLRCESKAAEGVVSTKGMGVSMTRGRLNSRVMTSRKREYQGNGAVWRIQSRQACDVLTGQLWYLQWFCGLMRTKHHTMSTTRLSGIHSCNMPNIHTVITITSMVITCTL